MPLTTWLGSRPFLWGRAGLRPPVRWLVAGPRFYGFYGASGIIRAG